MLRSREGIVSLILLLAGFVYPAAMPARLWWCLPVAIWAVLVPAMLAYRQEDLPRHGPPHWLRRFLFWFPRRLGPFAPLLVPLVLFSVWNALGKMLWQLAARRFMVEGIASVPLALVHLFLNMGFVFLIRTHRLHPTRTLMSLLTLEVAGRLIQFNWLYGWQGYEGLVIGMKGIALYAFAAMLEVRAFRDLPPIGLRECFAEAISAHGKLDGDFITLLRKVIRVNALWRYLVPLCLVATLLGLFFEKYNPGTLSPKGLPFSFISATIVCIVSLILSIVDASNGVRTLLQRGILSELLLTPIKAPEILAVTAYRGLRPLVRTLILLLFLLEAFHLMGNPLWVQVHIPATILGIVVLTVLLGGLLVGPLVEATVRGKTALLAVFKTLGQFVGLELIVVGLINFTFMQSAFVEEGLRVLAILAPHLLVFLWVFVRWQRLLLDFTDLAHGNVESERWLATREQVKAYRDGLGSGAVG